MTAAERAAEEIHAQYTPYYGALPKHEQKHMSEIIAREYAELEHAADEVLTCMVANGSCEHQTGIREALAKVRGA